MASEPIFQPLSGETIDNDALEVTEIESVCMKCFGKGTTRMMLTRIPFFKDIVISSFECEDPDCGFKNNEIMNAGKIAENGVKYTFQMKDRRDLHRNLVRSEYCEISIPELQFEIPVGKENKGIFTTIEGLLNRALDDIERDQVLRRIQMPEIAEQIDAFLDKARTLCGLYPEKEEIPNVTIIFSDPSGNSYVDNPHAPYPDNRLRVDHFVRNREQNILMGLIDPDEHPLAEGDNSKDNQDQDSGNFDNSKEIGQGDHQGNEGENYIPAAHDGLDLQNEVLTIPTNCPECNAVCSANFKTIQIPFFKDVIIMAIVCDACGYKSNEVKSGSGFSEKGKKISLFLNNPCFPSTDLKIDLARDILKSETASISIPELNFDIGRGAIEGKFTTVEGILQDIQRVVKKNPFTAGDSLNHDKEENQRQNSLQKFLSQIDEILEGKMVCTLVVDDPAGNSYVQNTNAPDDDPQLEFEDYERTFEQNEDLGLNDMNTDNYKEE